jgi:hypothetical protein
MKRKEGIWKSSGPSIAGTPSFGDENTDPWPRKEACCWIFADLYDHFGRFDRTGPIVDAACEMAKPDYDAWLELDLEVQSHLKYVVEAPQKQETVQDYLERISSEIYKNRYCKSAKWRSLRSFVSHLRELYPLNERGCIEEVFPEEMRLVNGKIAKAVSPTGYPIDIYTTAEILKGLAAEILEGRPNAQFCAAEAFGLCLACLTCARRRLPTQLKLVTHIPIDCLVLPESPENADEKNRPLLMVQTLYGPSPVPISLTMANYFDAIRNLLPKNRKTLFQSDPRSLRRVLDGIVEKIPSAVNLGRITFSTFLSHPHEAIGQR